MLLNQKKRNYIVIYPSGDQTESMDKKTAKDYTKIFGGKVVKRSIKRERIEKK